LTGGRFISTRTAMPPDQVLLDDAVQIVDGHPVVEDAAEERLARALLVHHDVRPAQAMAQAVLVDELDPLLQAARLDGLGQTRRQRAEPRFSPQVGPRQTTTVSLRAASVNPASPSLSRRRGSVSPSAFTRCARSGATVCGSSATNSSSRRSAGAAQLDQRLGDRDQRGGIGVVAGSARYIVR
jgi:hypothetical protein